MNKCVHHRLNFTTNPNFYTNSEISLIHFYYLNLKCFEIIFRPSFKEEDFYFKTNKLVLYVYLNDDIYRQHSFVYFLYRETESRQIGGSFLHKIGKTSKNIYKNAYEIEFQSIKIESKDKFEFLKNPSSLFYDATSVNDSTNYLETMKQKFKNKHKLASRFDIR